MKRNDEEMLFHAPVLHQIDTGPSRWCAPDLFRKFATLLHESLQVKLAAPAHDSFSRGSSGRRVFAPSDRACRTTLHASGFTASRSRMFDAHHSDSGGPTLVSTYPRIPHDGMPSRAPNTSPPDVLDGTPGLCVRAVGASQTLVLPTTCQSPSVQQVDLASIQAATLHAAMLTAQYTMITTGATPDLRRGWSPWTSSTAVQESAVKLATRGSIRNHLVYRDSSSPPPSPEPSNSAPRSWERDIYALVWFRCVNGGAKAIQTGH
jgi:hypothetical protein